MSKEETIPQDVSGSDPEAAAAGEAAGNEDNPNQGMDPLSVRERKMAAAAEKRIEHREGERKSMALINDPDLTEDEYDARKAAAEGEKIPDADPDDLDPDDAEELELQQRADGTYVDPDPDPEPAPASLETQVDEHGWKNNTYGERVKVLMVNGQPREVSETEYDRMAQKDLAGDEKLRRANQMEQELSARARRIEEREAALENPPATQQGADLDELIGRQQEALLSGDTDGAATLMKEIVQSGRSEATPSMEELVETVSTNVEARRSIQDHQDSVDEGFSLFERDYSDVLNDPDARAIADAHIKRLRTEKPGMAPKDIIVSAGEYASKRLGLGGGPTPKGENQPTGDDNPSRAERTERKGNLKPLPNLTNKRTKAPPKEAVDHSPGAAIRRMRQSRNLA